MRQKWPMHGKTNRCGRILTEAGLPPPLCSSHTLILHQKRSTHIYDRELFQDSTELLIERVLRKLDLPHVEVADPADLEVLVDDLRPKRKRPKASQSEH